MENKLVHQAEAFTLLFVTAFLLMQCNTESPTDGKLEEGFINPAKENRALALWPWLNGYVDTTRLVYELEQMKSKGMRGTPDMGCGFANGSW